MTTDRQVKNNVHIRWMIRRDMPGVLQIEEASQSLPWSEEDFLRCLRQRNCIGMVAELGEKVIGATIYELHKSSFHILNFAVHPAFHRQGIGSQMIQKLVSRISSHRLRRLITVDVRESNLPAQLFFKDCGFQCRDIKRGHFQDAGKDAYRFIFKRKTIAESAV